MPQCSLPSGDSAIKKPEGKKYLPDNQLMPAFMNMPETRMLKRIYCQKGMHKTPALYLSGSKAFA